MHILVATGGSTDSHIALQQCLSIANYVCGRGNCLIRYRT